MTHWPAPTLRHLGRLTDEIGVVEHADLATPRTELGYCTDDAGRSLAIAALLNRDPDAERVATTSLRFLERAHAGDGKFHLRLGPGSAWTDDPPSDDASGRALLGLGTAAGVAPWPNVRRRAAGLFDHAVAFRSAHPRATAYAVLGAVEVLYAVPWHREAHRLVADGADVLVATEAPSRGSWLWPAARLTYANALLPHARLAAAHVLGRHRDADDALALLAWLVDNESRGTWFSFTPVGGRGPEDGKPAFDQQPIEAWAMADACAFAADLTGKPRWTDAVRRAGRWFLGDNDAGAVMFDPGTGGGLDGLARGGANPNQGAESTLAFVATMRSVWTVDRPRRVTTVASGDTLTPRHAAAVR